MALELTYQATTNIPVEVEGLTPDWTRDKSLAEIERFEIFDGNRKTALAEMFAVAGDPTDGRIDWHGDLSGVHWIGAHMTGGEVHVHGRAGRHLGAEMSGGSIAVSGDAGGWVGAEMHGGSIHVRGDAGHLVGAAYRGSAKGMTGGVILVEGSAGNEIGLTMRRGLIAIGGDAGDMTGFNLIAGTVVVLGAAGIRPGAGMRRGTIALLGETPTQLLPTFRRAGPVRLPMLPLLFRDLLRRGFAPAESWQDQPVDLYHGDLVALGRGEILMRAA